MEFTLEEVKALTTQWKTEVDTEIQGLSTQLTGFDDLKKSNHELTIKSLMVAEGMEEDLFDLVKDDDIELVKNKITLLKDKVTTKVDNNFVPTKAKKDDEYQKAIKNKDTEGAVRSKLSKLFG